MLSALSLFALAYVGNGLERTKEGTGLVFAAQIVSSAELLPGYDSEGKQMRKVRKIMDKDESEGKIRKKLGKAEKKLIKARNKLQKVEFKIPEFCDVDDDEDRRRNAAMEVPRRRGNDFALMDNNVTIAHLKNLVIDKPAPITTKLSMGQLVEEEALFPGGAVNPEVASVNSIGLHPQIPALTAFQLGELAQEIERAAERVDRAMGSAGSYSTFIVAIAEELTKNVSATFEEAKEMLNKKFQKRWKKMDGAELLSELLEQAKAHDAVNERTKKLRNALKSGKCDQ